MLPAALLAPSRRLSGGRQLCWQPSSGRSPPGSDLREARPEERGHRAGRLSRPGCCIDRQKRRRQGWAARRGGREESEDRRLSFRMHARPNRPEIHSGRAEKTVRSPAGLGRRPTPQCQWLAARLLRRAQCTSLCHFPPAHHLCGSIEHHTSRELLVSQAATASGLPAYPRTTTATPYQAQARIRSRCLHPEQSRFVSCCLVTMTTPEQSGQQRKRSSHAQRCAMRVRAALLGVAAGGCYAGHGATPAPGPRAFAHQKDGSPAAAGQWGRTAC